MVSQFPLDYMHLVLLGIMRKLLRTWLQGFPVKQRIGRVNKDKISANLLAFARYCPAEIARKPRSLDQLAHWKATEYRTILCYTGVVAFKGILSKEAYINFKLLLCGVRILLNKDMCQSHNDLANEMLISFAKSASKLYEQRIMTYNMHGIIHLAAEAKKFGNLDNISSFPFENFLYSLKKKLRKAGDTLQQIVYRTLEQQRLDSVGHVPALKFKFLKPHADGPVPHSYDDCAQFQVVTVDGVRYSVNRRNGCVIVGERIGVIANILCRDRKLVLCAVNFFKVIGPLFDYPIASNIVGIFKVSQLNQTTDKREVHKLSDCKKCMLMPLQKSFVAVRLNSLH